MLAISVLVVGETGSAAANLESMVLGRETVAMAGKAINGEEGQV